MPAAIEELGAGIGSDVPFFLNSAAAIVAGRGEEVRPIEARDDFFIVIAFPGFPVATAGAYALLDKVRPDADKEVDLDPEEILQAYCGDIGRWPFSNSFEPVISGTRPEISRGKSLLLGSGASYAAMSGSGSSIFGIFEDESKVEMAKRLLGKAGFSVYAASPLARYTALD
jgi:4-diphosphocytidyl-2-C-methyl-D-erythritol kinase